jgi:hypothetical protein
MLNKARVDVHATHDTLLDTLYTFLGEVCAVHVQHNVFMLPTPNASFNFDVDLMLKSSNKYMGAPT